MNTFHSAYLRCGKRNGIINFSLLHLQTKACSSIPLDRLLRNGYKSLPQFASPYDGLRYFGYRIRFLIAFAPILGKYPTTRPNESKAFYNPYLRANLLRSYL